MSAENIKALSLVESNKNIIPDTTISFYEASLYMAQDNEREYSKLFESIGINELAVFESTGSEVIYEGENLDKLRDAISKFFVKAQSNIKGFYEKVIAKIQQDSKKAQIIKDISNNHVKKIVDKNYGTTHTFFKASDLKFAQNAAKIAEKLKKAAASGNIDENAFKALIIKGIMGGSKKELKNALIGDTVEADKAYIVRNFNAMKAIVMNGRTVEGIKQIYSSQKAALSKMMTDASKVSQNPDIIAKYMKLMKDIINVMNSSYSIACDVYVKRFQEYRNILVKVAKAPEEAVKEASIYESSNDITNDLFNF